MNDTKTEKSNGKSKPKRKQFYSGDQRIEIVVSRKEKEKWKQYVKDNDDDFKKLSHMIRYAVKLLIEGNLEKTRIEKPIEKEESKILELMEMQNQKIDKLYDTIEKLKKIENIEDDTTLKGLIHERCKRKRYTAEELAYHFEKPLGVIMVQLNELRKDKLITHYPKEKLYGVDLNGNNHKQ